MQTLGPDLLLGKSNRNRDTIIEAIAKSLSPTTPASGHDRSSITTHAITTNRSKQGLRNPSLESGSDRSSFAVDRQTLLRVSARRSTADCSESAVVSPQNATTSTRNRSTGEISP
jgi:hypothetical protein